MYDWNLEPVASNMFGIAPSLIASPLFGIPPAVAPFPFSCNPVVAAVASLLLALTPPDQWRRLLDRHVGMALQKEATKRKHWLEDLGAPSSQFYVKQGRLHLGDDVSYAVQLLGVEGMDAFLWAWALTEEMKASDPALDLPPELICDALKNHPELTQQQQQEENNEKVFPEFATTDPIPLSLTHSGQTFADIAAGVLADQCRAVYQVPDYATGLIYYWIITDEAFPLEGEDTTISACARLSAVIQTMIHPHARHRVTNIRQAIEGYAQALDLQVVPNDDASQLTATPRNVFWGDSLLVFCDPEEDKVMGISGQYDGALHTTWVEYDEFGKFDKLDIQPSLDLATGLPVGVDEKDDIRTETESDKTPAINGSNTSNTNGN